MATAHAIEIGWADATVTITTKARAAGYACRDTVRLMIRALWTRAIKSPVATAGAASIADDRFC